MSLVNGRSYLWAHVEMGGFYFVFRFFHCEIACLVFLKCTMLKYPRLNTRLSLDFLELLEVGGQGSFSGSLQLSTLMARVILKIER